MIPLIIHTPRLLLLAASRALLTAELHKPQYFATLLGAALPAGWPTADYDRAAQEFLLARLTADGRTAAGWYNWYVLRKAEGETGRTLVGTGGFMGPPDAVGTVEISSSLVPEWRGQGLGTELVAGLVQQATDTGMVRRLVAHADAADLVSRRVLQRNAFELTGTAQSGSLRFEREIVPAAVKQR